ncbi:CarboxypepD_reg-like domain-containing protein [Thermoflavifilum thermophilum]|uniref:CarboxypepD_reg-like domain-containing protein n=1 Tax=Thermoflavifilum thermophilum TaxID=1393122 RepID=A0A1I7N2K5_9BACT|nr:CarboxypepD_reg-like domain-containing protein [Thermoflavifilum thermophilum]
MQVPIKGQKHAAVSYRLFRKYEPGPFWLLSFLLLAGLFPAKLHAQDVVFGKVMDNTTRLPLAGATVINRSTGEGTLTDTAGMYRIHARLHDWIVFSYIGYAPDSIQIRIIGKNGAIVNVFLRPTGYLLNEIRVQSRRIDYYRDSMERRELYGFALGQEKTHGLGAVAHPISGLFDALSKRQKQIWHFQKIEQQFEQQQYIASRIKVSLVEQLTGLHGDTLKLFLENYYHPDYEWVRFASDYDLYADILKAARQFKAILPTYAPLHDSLFLHAIDDTLVHPKTKP